MNREVERLKNGIITENPTFVQMLGMCPTLAVTTSAINGMGMGLTTTVILVMSNLMIALLRKFIPDKVRIPAFIVIIASFVTIVQFLLQGFIPDLYDSLGIYIPLIVVNCIILGRAEAYASKNPVLPSIFDGLGMGIGFTVGLTLIGTFRELIGNGSVFNINIAPDAYEPIVIFILAPGAFFVLAFLNAFINRMNRIKKTNEENVDSTSTCSKEQCAGCTNSMCGGSLLQSSSESESIGNNDKRVSRKDEASSSDENVESNIKEGQKTSQTNEEKTNENKITNTDKKEDK